MKTRTTTRGILFVTAGALAWLLPLLGQESRSAISGRVLDPQSSSVPGATVTVTNTDTNVSIRAVANETGYYEAKLLVPGTYRVSAEASGFKVWVHGGIVLPVATRLQLDARLEVGSATETVQVTAAAPLIDVNAASSGTAVSNRSIMDMPTSKSNPIQLAKLVPGAQAPGTVLSNNSIDLGNFGSSGAINVAGGVGGNEFAIDGAPMNGAGRNFVSSVPAQEQIAELKVETSGFDASFGHSTGAWLSVTSKAGTNQLHGTLRNGYWGGPGWTAMGLFPKQDYYRQIAQAESSGNPALAKQLRDKGAISPAICDDFGVSIGGPVVLPRLFNGKDRLFFFFSLAGYRVDAEYYATATVPTMAHRAGNFSDLLLVDAVRYQIYDPLSVRPDPNRRTHVIRDAFPGNVIPRSRVVNPAYDFYTRLLPAPDNPPAPGAEPTNNYVAGNYPGQYSYLNPSSRMDYYVSGEHRIFGRWGWLKKKNRPANWMYQSPVPDMTMGGVDNIDAQAKVDWVYTRGARTMLNASISADQYSVPNVPQAPLRYKAADVGLPAYLDAKAGSYPILPGMNWSGYDTYTRQGPSESRVRSITWKTDFFHVRGSHSIKAGLDARSQVRSGYSTGWTTGNYTFNNAFTRRDDDGNVPAGNLGLSWAAFMLGLPSAASISTNASYIAGNPYYGFFVQDEWRVNRKLSLVFGFRGEYELGPTERYNRMIGTFDAGAALPITAGAQAAYAKSPLAELPAQAFAVQGGSLYAGVNGAPRRLWNNALNWMPRLAAAYSLNSRTVVRAGYGMFFDTLNMQNEGIDQTGFSRATNTVLTTDFGQTWLAGNPAAGVSPLVDPFPVRADGARFDSPLGSALGLMAKAGSGWTYTPFERKHARQHRWRAGVQRQFGSSMVLDVAYAGSYSDQIGLGLTESALPQQYWNQSMTRNAALASDMNNNVANPFYIGNFAALKQSDPVIYNDMAAKAFFTSATIRKNQLLRPFPQMNNLVENVPTAADKTHELDIGLQRRFSRGLSLDVAYTRLYQRARNYYVNEYDTTPAWRESNNGRPWRFAFSTVYELPFGKGRPLLKSGIPSWFLGGFQISLIGEFQPGPLLLWGNVFYYGDLSDIKHEGWLPDRWFNVDAGFERNASKAPAAFQARVFPTIVDGLRADWVHRWNGEIKREFRIKERTALQFGLNVINLTNNTLLDAPNMNPLSSDFGRSLSALASPRQLTAMVKLRF